MVLSCTGRLRRARRWDSCLVPYPSSSDVGTRTLSPVSYSSNKSYPKSPTSCTDERRTIPKDLNLPIYHCLICMWNLASLPEKNIVWVLNASGDGILGTGLTITRSLDLVQRLILRKEHSIL